VQALIRRSSRNQEAVLQAGAVELDPQTRSVRVSGELVELNSKEYGILEYLLRNKNKLVSTEELLEHVWDREIDMFTQTVRTNMKTLRRKIDPDKTFIKNIRGQGYVIR
jgi:DNA-binding response OmpR family regulator